MSSSTSSSQGLRKRLHDANIHLARLVGMRTADQNQRRQTADEVATAKGRQDLGEEVSGIFQALQTRAHERSVGGFERLLTAILQDVLPEEGSVRMLPSFKANTTWLDVALEKDSGKLEDILNGNGGAVTNVVCAGLRFAALSRTQNRRLMVLDEPDCWLKPERVPAFIRVIAQVSEQTRTQTFFVTHHDPALFEGDVNLVRFYTDASGKVHAEAMAPHKNHWTSDDQPGLRSIELVNLRRHEHTIIPCFPGATAFIGDNNLGKSTALVSSFNAMAYGESDDSMIRHDADEMRIVFHLEGGRRLEMSRARKRSPAVLYRQFEAGNPEPVREGRPPVRNQVPDWVTEILGVKRVDDMDIQVGNQKNPVFLLNESAGKRAQILSVGREASHLKVMMKRYEELRDTDGKTVKAGEARIARLDYRLERMKPLDGVNDNISTLFVEGEELMSSMERREELGRLLERYERICSERRRLLIEEKAFEGLPEKAPALQDLSALTRLIGAIGTGLERAKAPAVPALPVTPVLIELSSMARLASSIEVSARRSQGFVVPVLPEAPVLRDTSQILEVGKRLRTLHSQAKALVALPAEMPRTPELSEVARIQALMERLTAAAQQVSLTAQQSTQLDAEYDEAFMQHEQTKEACGGMCPLCGSGFPAAYKETSQDSTHAH